MLHKNKINHGSVSLFSSDENVWGYEIEDHHLKNTYWKAPETLYKNTASIDFAPTCATHITIGFSRGLPISLNK